jgi:O-antigen/teichoic acid export membrane protein
LGSDIAFQYLLIAMIFAYFTGWLTFTLVALEKQIKLLWINLASVIFNIVLNLIVIPVYGFRGATLASILTEALVMILAFVMILKIKPFKISFRNFWKIILAGTSMGVLVYFGADIFGKFGNIGIMALIGFAGLIYGVVLYMLKVLRKETFKLPVREKCS